VREDEEKAIRIIQAEQEIGIAKLVIKIEELHQEIAQLKLDYELLSDDYKRLSLVIKIEELQEILLRYVRGHQTAIDGIYCSQLMKEKA